MKVERYLFKTGESRDAFHPTRTLVFMYVNQVTWIITVTRNVETCNPSDKNQKLGQSDLVYWIFRSRDTSWASLLMGCLLQGFGSAIRHSGVLLLYTVVHPFLTL